MKRRILLSLVALFTMTTMWASLLEAYQIVPVAPTAKAGTTATITLNLKNKLAINNWTATIVLPEGVTYVEGSFAVAGSRVPEGYTPVLGAVVNADGSVKLSFASEEDGVALLGENDESAIATIDVQIGADVAAGDYKIYVNDATFIAPDGQTTYQHKEVTEANWIIEEAEVGLLGDLNGDGEVDFADAQTVLNLMADGAYDASADINEDGVVDLADFVSILNIIADAE